MDRLAGKSITGKNLKPAGFDSSKSDPAQAKKIMLQWCQSRTAGYGCKITNFSSSWADSIETFEKYMIFK